MIGASSEYVLKPESAVAANQFLSSERDSAIKIHQEVQQSGAEIEEYLGRALVYSGRN